MGTLLTSLEIASTDLIMKPIICLTIFRRVDGADGDWLSPSDYRFAKQLILGYMDVPNSLSMFPKSAFIPEMFKRVLRTNLRILVAQIPQMNCAPKVRLVKYT